MKNEGNIEIKKKYKLNNKRNPIIIPKLLIYKRRSKKYYIGLGWVCE